MTWQERERQRDLARGRLFVKILTAYGYGCLATGAGAGAFDGQFNLSEINVLLFSVGLALHAVAIYFTREGEGDADQS